MQMHFREILVLESSIPVNGQYVQQFQSTELDLILLRELITYTTFEIEANTPMMNYIVCLLTSLLSDPLDILRIDFEKDTFKTLWQLSEPNTETEECFLRIPQTEYFLSDRLTENSPGPDPLEEMPSVRGLFQRSPLEKFITFSADFLDPVPTHPTTPTPSQCNYRMHIPDALYRYAYLPQLAFHTVYRPRRTHCTRTCSTPWPNYRGWYWYLWRPLHCEGSSQVWYTHPGTFWTPYPLTFARPSRP